MASFINNLNIVLVCWIILLIVWFTSAFFVKKSVTKRKWAFQIFLRVIIFIFIIVALRFNGTGIVSFLTSLFQSYFNFTILGSIVAVVGLIGAIWARISLGREWSGYVTYKKEHELITRGPYRFVRHPIYSSILLMLIGTILYYGSILVFVIFFIAFIGFLWRTYKEEEIMTNLFKEKYQNYMKKTKRLIPFIY
jgi:protein-S-isoprenylcysteine O-methyltransferase Ste14